MPLAGNSGRINPELAEWLAGYPIRYTAISTDAENDRNHEKRLKMIGATQDVGVLTHFISQIKDSR